MLTNHNKPQSRAEFSSFSKEKSLKASNKRGHYLWPNNYYNNNHTHSCTGSEGGRQREREPVLPHPKIQQNLLQITHCVCVPAVCVRVCVCIVYLLQFSFIITILCGLYLLTHSVLGLCREGRGIAAASGCCLIYCPSAPPFPYCLCSLSFSFQQILTFCWNDKRKLYILCVCVCVCVRAAFFGYEFEFECEFGAQSIYRPHSPHPCSYPFNAPSACLTSANGALLQKCFQKKVCIAIKGPSKAWHKHRPRLYAIRVVLLRPLPHTNPQRTIRAVVSIVNVGKVARVKL